MNVMGIMQQIMSNNRVMGNPMIKNAMSMAQSGNSKGIEQMARNLSYITIENLNVSGMMKNRHLSKAVASQKFYEFRTKLKAKCDENGIELRVVDRWYPSSKICHCCGAIKKDLKLSDRIYRCDCGYVEDRDFNAALNLRDALTYEVA